MLNKDIWATNVYSLGFESDASSNLDYSKNIVNIDTKRKLIINSFKYK